MKPTLCPLTRFVERSVSFRLFQLTFLAIFFAWLIIPQQVWACGSCSQVAIKGSMDVATQSGALTLQQRDITLPGNPGIDSGRRYHSGAGSFTMFGYGWECGLINNLVTTSGDIQVNLGGQGETFKAADGYFNRDRSMQLSFHGDAPNQVVQVENRWHDKWLFDLNTKVCTATVDRYGNRTGFEMSVTNRYLGMSGTSYMYAPVFLLKRVTYPDAREVVFDYTSNLCTRVTAPDGSVIDYSYTAGLLTGVSQNNGQVLSYDYDTVSDDVNTRGWLKKMTYANGAEVNVAYNGDFGTTNALRVVGISGPHGFSRTYGYVLGTNGVTRTTVTDSRNNSTIYGFAEDGSQSTTNALGYTSQVTLDSEYRMSKSVDARGYFTSYVYDSNNPDLFARSNLLQTTNALGQVWSNTYNTNNLVTETIDPLGHKNQFKSDDKGSLLAVTNALGQQTVTKTYTVASQNPPCLGGLLASITDGRGNSTRFDRNGSGFVTNTVDALGNSWQQEYNSAGLMARSTDPLGHSVSVAYNAFNRPSAITNALGQVTRFAYDEMANVTNITDAACNSTSFSYDQLQRATKLRNALGHETRFAYDPESNLVTLSNAMGRAYSWSYDPVNQTKTFTCPDNSRETYVFDPNGNVTGVTNRANQVTSAVFDAGNRMTSLTFEGASPTVFGLSYDNADRLTSITRIKGTVVESAVTNSFDAANRLVQQMQNGLPVGFSYDITGGVTNITYPSGLNVTYSLDPRNRIKSISDRSTTSHQPPTPLAAYEYDSAGRLIRRALENSTECLYSYNDANRVTNIVLQAVGKDSKEHKDKKKDKDVLQSFSYGYDSVGNRAWVRYKDGSGDVYQYDPTYQVTGVKYGVSDPTAGYTAASWSSGNVGQSRERGTHRAVTYSFDTVGNRISVTEDLQSTLYTVNALDQYTAVGSNSVFQYNANGCLTGDGTWTFEYDHDNRLIGATNEDLSVRYGYDGFGRRISKTFTHVERHGRHALKHLVDRLAEEDVPGLEDVDTVAASMVPERLKRLDRYYVYSGDQLIEERDGRGVVVAKYIYEGGIDRPVKVIKRNKAYYFMQDALGNVTALTDENGNLIEQYDYDIYGAVTVNTAHGRIKNRMPMTSFAARGGSFRFTGREYDGETGLYHYRARVYSAELGRFLQPDPIGFAGRDFNLYRYCANNPVRFADPFGLQYWWEETHGNYGGSNVINGMYCEEGQRGMRPEDIGPPVGPDPVDWADEAFLLHDRGIAEYGTTVESDSELLLSLAIAPFRTPLPYHEGRAPFYSPLIGSVFLFAHPEIRFSQSRENPRFIEFELFRRRFGN